MKCTDHLKLRGSQSFHCHVFWMTWIDPHVPHPFHLFGWRLLWPDWRLRQMLRCQTPAAATCLDSSCFFASTFSCCLAVDAMLPQCCQRCRLHRAHLPPASPSIATVDRRAGENLGRYYYCQFWRHLSLPQLLARACLVCYCCCCCYLCLHVYWLFALRSCQLGLQQKASSVW